MYRFLLTPRWWAINIFVVLSIPFCLFMGSWQLSRFEDRVDSHRTHQGQTEQAAQQPAEPLAELLPVSRQTSGRIAEATGSYDTQHQFLSPGRTLDGERGSYVVSLLRLDADPGAKDGHGAALPVVRGWLPGDPDPSDVPPPPSGRTTVTGALQSNETIGDTTGLGEGRIGRVSAAVLVNLVPYDVQDAWITVQDPKLLPEPLKAVPPTLPKGSGLDLKAFQNLGYSAEWFAFVGFALFMWFRFFRRDLELARDAELGITASGGTPGGGTSPKPGAAADADTSPNAADADASPNAGGAADSDAPGPAAAGTAGRAAEPVDAPQAG
ncbi:SURF1 family protein [Streptomyces durbertensis]|uniref:SURF1-like protein n=1 Tax=Streptomyces durbertensis TaxID=2448886 RepID=A0ABR6EJ93_9ACTN|nr:SURF1 family protein [Streptomyces durbertensis]MBB1245407.1 SURF1 family protein [Streptomyces durbertensis]